MRKNTKFMQHTYGPDTHPLKKLQTPSKYIQKGFHLHMTSGVVHKLRLQDEA